MYYVCHPIIEYRGFFNTLAVVKSCMKGHLRLEKGKRKRRVCMCRMVLSGCLYKWTTYGYKKPLMIYLVN